MLLEPDHNAVLLLLGWRTWYSEQGSLEALYPHALQFRLTQSKISPLCRRYRSCVRSLSKSHCIQAAPLAGHAGHHSGDYSNCRIRIIRRVINNDARVGRVDGRTGEWDQSILRAS